LEDQGVDRKIILSSIFRKQYVGALIGSSWLGVGTGNEHSGYIKYWEFLDYLKTS